jgi:anti-sigma B factor antagonist
MPVKVQVEHRRGSVIVLIDAETIETDNVSSFRSAVGPALEESVHAVLDLSNVQFMDSTGLGALLSCLRMMKAKDGSLRLASLTPEVRRLFDMVLMDRVFDIHPDTESAITATSG